MASTIQIDLFTDVVCPWCLIGTARLDQAIAALDPDVAVEVRQHPFLLDPTTPREGRNTRDYLASKYDGDIDAMRQRVVDAARDAGIDLDLSVQPMSYSTIDAHTVIRHALPEGRYGLAKRMAEAYFLEGRNIADRDVLKEIAGAFGMAPERIDIILDDPKELETTRALALSASQQGISGVPFFIFNNQFALSGAQPPEVFARAFRVALGEETLPAQ